MDIDHYFYIYDHISINEIYIGTYWSMYYEQFGILLFLGFNKIKEESTETKHLSIENKKLYHKY